MVGDKTSPSVSPSPSSSSQSFAAAKPMRASASTGRLTVPLAGILVVVAIVASWPVGPPTAAAAVAVARYGGCPPAPVRRGRWRVAYGVNFVQYTCPRSWYWPGGVYRLTCSHGSWQGHVPTTCGWQSRTRPPARRRWRTHAHHRSRTFVSRPPTVAPAAAAFVRPRPSPQFRRARLQLADDARAAGDRPVPAASTSPVGQSACGPAPGRRDMLMFVGTRAEFVDYYCRPPAHGHWQPFAYRLRCKFGRWLGELPPRCPTDVRLYPKNK